MGRTSVTRRRRRVGLALAALVGAAAGVDVAPAGAVDLRPVTVTILRITGPNPDLDVNPPGDYYVGVKIGDNATQVNDGSAVESSDFTPFWTFTRMIDRDLGVNVPIQIELFDADLGIDDEIDINPIDNKVDIDLVFNLDTGLWTGDAAGQEFGFAAGEGDLEHYIELYRGTRGTLLFDINTTDGDFDDDGIPDGIERFGIRDENGVLVTDMAAMGADPCRKDIAVEIDYHTFGGHSHRPSDAARAEVVAAFDNAPVPAAASCPYAGFPLEPTGIGLLLDVDDAIAVPAEPSKDEPFGMAELKATKDDNALKARDPYFYYNLWIHTMDGSNISGRCCSESSDFITSLGQWDPAPNGTDRDQAGTFMHEFGHSLGLGHGGVDGVNHKPNYLSIMSYRFQTTGIPDADLLADLLWDGGVLEAASRVDYSRTALPDLDETNLNEAAGIGNGDSLTAWVDPARETRAARGDTGIDWDFDAVGGPPFEGSVAVDVNSNKEEACVTWGENKVMDATAADDDLLAGSRIYSGPDRTCDTAAAGDDEQTNAVGYVQPAILKGASDWDKIEYQAGMSPFFGMGTGDEHNEISFDESQEIKAAWKAATNPCSIPTVPPPGAIIVAAAGLVTQGTSGPDIIIGTAGFDRIHGLGGNDTIYGGGGNDQLYGGDGDDILCGGADNDLLSGGEGADRMSGDLGNDNLSGSGGDDKLLGGPGTDLMAGGGGTDTCTPGGDPGDVALPAPQCETVVT